MLRTSGPKWPFWPFSGMGDLPLLEELQRGVVGVRGQLDDAVQTLAAVGRPLRDAEGAVGDGLDEALRVVGDPAEQVDRLPQDGVGAPVDEPAGRWREVLGQAACGV